MGAVGATVELDGVVGTDWPCAAGEDPGRQSGRQAVGVLSGALSLPGLSGGGRERGLSGQGPAGAGCGVSIVWRGGVAMCSAGQEVGLDLPRAAGAAWECGQQHPVFNPALGASKTSGQLFVGGGGPAD